MTAGEKCQRCGAATVPGGRFCTNCGTGTHESITFLSQRHGLIALAATLGWVMATVFLAEYEAGIFVLLCMFGVVLPTMIFIAAALYWLYGRRPLISLGSEPLYPAVIVLMTLAWLSVSLVLVSDPEDEDAIPLVLGLVYTLIVMAGWVGVLVAAIQIGTGSGWGLLKRVAWVISYLLPLPVAAWIFFYPVGENFLALDARFELSEAALDRTVSERPTTSHRAGLFQISRIEDVESCVFLETGGAVLADGFAYCPSGRPSRAMRSSPPDILMYPLNGDWETADWWEYEITENSY